jgi:hypothetical protein
MNARALAVTAALLAAGLPVAARASAPALAATTVLTATSTSRLTVQLPIAARLPADPAKAVSFEGNGRLLGLVLREQREESPDEATYLRLPDRFGRRVYGWVGASGAGAGTLHRGAYTLTVLTDGSPVTVTLHLLGLTGSTDLDLTSRAEGAIVPIHLSFDPGTTDGVTWSGGAGLRPTGAADLFTLVWWQQADSTVVADGACWYDGDGVEALGPRGWVPGCPGGSGITMADTGALGATNGGQRGGLGWASIPQAQDVGLGYWTLAQGINNVGGIAVWLER